MVENTQGPIFVCGFFAVYGLENLSVEMGGILTAWQLQDLCHRNTDYSEFLKLLYSACNLDGEITI